MRAPLWLTAAALLGTAASAHADDLQATLGQPIEEMQHVVDARVEDGVAVLTVTRRFRNGGDRADEAVVTIELPEGAAATGLRILAGGVWYEGQLLEAEAAAEMYRELTGLGAWEPRDPALLYWIDRGVLGLQMFPVPPGGLYNVQYTLTVPLVYEDGRYLVRYPAAPSPGLVKPILHAPQGGKVRVEDGALVLDVAPPPMPGGVVARQASFGVSFGRTFLRVEVDAAPQLEPAPRDARVVFVLDASWSEGEVGIAAQIELVRGYLAALPDAKFDVVVFRRSAERLAGKFVPASQLDTWLARGKARLAPGNGSHLDAGLALAAQALAGETRPARIVVLTDARMRPALTTEAAIAAVRAAPPGTIVHVVHREPETEGALEEEREDHHPLAPLAEAYGGIALRVSGRSSDVKQLAAIALGLVRPIRVDGFTVEVSGLDPDTLGVPEALPEGQAYRAMLITGAAPARVRVRGRIWARDLILSVPVDAALLRRLPALIAGDPLIEELDEDEMMRVATAGRAVSPVTSYLAIEPGVRPSTAGIDRGRGFGAIGMGAGGYGYGVGAGAGSGRPDLLDSLAALLAPGAAACAKKHAFAGGAGPIVIRLDTTGDEVVDVAVAGAPTAAAQACLEEVAWAIRLDPTTFQAVDGRWDVTLTP